MKKVQKVKIISMLFMLCLFNSINAKNIATISEAEEVAEEEYIEELDNGEENEEAIDDNEDYAYKENQEYVERVFKNKEDIELIQKLVSNFNNRNFTTIYNDFNSGKYKDIVDKFIDNYSEIFSDFKVEFNKEKYYIFYSSIIERWRSDDFKELREEIEAIQEKYKNESDEIIKYTTKQSFKTLIINLNKGKYKDYINEVWQVYMQDKYKDLRDTINYDFVEGDYADITYDTIYYLFDTTYKYKLNYLMEESIDNEEENESMEVVIDNEEEGREMSTGALLLILIVLLAIVGGVVGYKVYKVRMNKKNEES